MSRRINRELTIYNNFFNQENIQLIEYEQETNIIKLVMIIRDRVLFVNLNFPREYPFQPPKVLIYKDGNKYNYLDLLYLNKEWYDYFSLKGCFCCNSILCKWCIPNNIKQVIEEIQNNLDYKLRIREIMMCRSIVKQKFGTYIPIETFL